MVCLCVKSKSISIWYDLKAIAFVPISEAKKYAILKELFFFCPEYMESFVEEANDRST